MILPCSRSILENSYLRKQHLQHVTCNATRYTVLVQGSFRLENLQCEHFWNWEKRVLFLGFDIIIIKNSSGYNQMFNLLHFVKAYVVESDI